MTGLIIEIHAPEDYIQSSAQMEENYVGIHRKAIWEKAPKVHFDPLNIQLPFYLPYIPRLIYAKAKERHLKNKYEKLLDSFKQKVENPKGEHYIDRIARKEGIGIPPAIKPFTEISYQLRKKLGLAGIEFRTDVNRHLEYIIAAGSC